MLLNLDALGCLPLDDMLRALGTVPPEQEAERDRVTQLFACDCVERVIPIWAAQYPDDQRPQQAVAVARRYAMGEATGEALAAARAAVFAATRLVETQHGDACWAANCVARAATAASMDTGAAGAARKAGWVAEGNTWAIRECAAVIARDAGAVSRAARESARGVAWSACASGLASWAAAWDEERAWQQNALCQALTGLRVLRRLLGA